VTARLTSAVLASGLLRRAEQGGGFGAVLAKGDPTAGAIMVILVERGVRTALLERLLQPDGLYAWQETGQGAADDEALRTLLDRRRKYDPDLWILELDVASAERFAAEMNDAG
jgi:hypothetical protein